MQTSENAVIIADSLSTDAFLPVAPIAHHPRFFGKFYEAWGILITPVREKGLTNTRIWCIIVHELRGGA